MLDDPYLTAYLEVALLVEPLVIGKLLFAITGEHLTIADPRGSVVDTLVGVFRITRNDADTGRTRTNPLERGIHLAPQSLVKEQILGRVAAQAQFRKQDQIGAE